MSVRTISDATTLRAMHGHSSICRPTNYPVCVRNPSSVQTVKLICRVICNPPPKNRRKSYRLVGIWGQFFFVCWNKIIKSAVPYPLIHAEIISAGRYIYITKYASILQYIQQGVFKLREYLTTI